MKLDEAKKLFLEKKLSEVVGMRNPENRQQWFLSFLDQEKKVFMLVDNGERVITYRSADDLIAVAESVGFRVIRFQM